MSIKFVLKRNSRSSPTTNNKIIAEYSFNGNLFTIGSDPANNLVIEESVFEQAVVVQEGEQLMLINSAEGTKLNGELLRREAIQPLLVNDEIGIGDYLILIADSEQTMRQEASVFTTNEDEIVDVYATTQNIPLDVYATTQFNVSEIGETKSEPIFNASPQTQIVEESPSNEVEIPQESAPQRNFADILDTLRTEDDSFYFTVKTDAEEIKRITLDQVETTLGVSPTGKIVAVAEHISTVCAVARKDWSGILVESQKSGAVLVNGKKITEPHRLRHDDEIVFTALPKFSLILHEPSSLVALESLLSARNNSNSRFGLGTNNQNLAVNETIPEEVKKESFLEHKYLKYFSFVEFVMMIIGTLIGAVLIFLLLEFIFS